MSGRDPDDGDGFLRRWSRRKSADPEIAPEIAEENAVAPADDAAPSETEQTEADEQAIADLPDIDTLDKESDYTGFMRDGVPEALRNRALRKLWLSDPVLANLDGLNDYDEDFGAILKEGAAYMKRLADAGERMTRPGAEDDAPEGTDSEDIEEDIEEDIVDGIADGDAEQAPGDAAPEDETSPGSA